MDIDEFFDPDNIIHIEALSHLNNRGCWPKDFLPDNITFPAMWLFKLYNKLTNRWVKYMFDKEKLDDQL